MPYVGPRAGGLASVDKATGLLRWLIASDRADKASVYGFASAPVIGDGRVFAADLAGTVVAFNDD
jgi:outer membrane protein assembly factor BamB